jgi:FMN reductase
MTEQHSKREDILIAGIGGSLRDGSYTAMAVQLALSGAAEAGAKTDFIDLRKYNLMFCNGGDDADVPADVIQLRERVRKANGLILGTPEYHGSFSGVLKNALDLMGFDEFEGKMLGLIGVAGGRMGAFSALNHLRYIGRALHAWVVPEQISIPQAWKEFDDSGSLKDPELLKRVKDVGRQVARFAYLHSSDASREFLRLWEEAPENPGGESR